MTQNRYANWLPPRGDRPHWTRDTDQAGTFWRWCCDKKKLDPGVVLRILGVDDLTEWAPPQICARATILLWLKTHPPPGGPPTRKETN